jgi:hypothetical protein
MRRKKRNCRHWCNCFQSTTGLYYPLGTIGTVPRAYEGMEGRTNIMKLKTRKFNTKFKFKNTFFFQKPKFHYTPTCEMGSV